MWTHQNGFKHGLTGLDQQQLKERLQEEIEEEYEQGTDNLLPHDQHWQWLTSVANARDRYHNRQTTDPSLNQQRTLLQNWLSTTTTTNNNNH